MAGNLESFSLEHSASPHLEAHGLREAFFSAMTPKPASPRASDLPAAAPVNSPASELGFVKIPGYEATTAPDLSALSVPEGKSAAAAPIPGSETVGAPSPGAGSEISQAAPEAISESPSIDPAEFPDIPPPIQSALESGNPITFSSSGDNQAANVQPNYFLTPSGQLIPNENAPPPDPDAPINIEIQSAKPEGNKSLQDAIMHESDMQRQAAKEMISLYMKSHPGAEVPEWMNNLANARPNLPDFVPETSAPTPAPENGFVNRGVRPGNSGGFRGNGGFDGSGMFRGNGSSGDGTLDSGGSDNAGRPLKGGETVQAKQIYDYLTNNYGLSPVAASGILGNMMTESSMKTHAFNKGEGAIGLCQWEGGRRRDLEHFAAAEGKPVTDWKVQVDFMMHELQGKESGAFAKLQHAQTPGQAAAIFDRYFERSAGTSRGQRMGNAEQVHRQLASTPSAPVA